MASVEIYTSPACGYCHRVKRLLVQKGVSFAEVDVVRHPDRRPEMERRSGRRTVPQVFIDGAHVGGCDDLYALDASGRLDPLLAGA